MAKMAALTLVLTPEYVLAFHPSALRITQRSIALRELPNDVTATPSAATTSSTASDWIQDEFEQVHISPKDDVATGSYTSSRGLLNQGRVVGPARVLVYDTTLRGELI